MSFGAGRVDIVSETGIMGNVIELTQYYENGKGDVMKMKKMKAILICLAIVIAGLFIYALVSWNGGNKESEPEGYTDGQNGGEMGSAASSMEDLTTELTTEDMTAGEEKNNKFTYQDVEYEFLSYEVIEDTDIATQTKYAAANFFSGELPDPNELEEYRDMEAIKAECPELKEAWENDDAYTNEEVAEIFHNNIDIINKYTNMVHLKTRYFFINCQITNTSDEEKDVYMNEIRFILSSPDQEQSLAHDNICYFDASSHTQGDDRIHEFFVYTLQPGETLNCTIGFPAKEEIEDQEYYFGMVYQESNPVKSKSVIRLSGLEETGE